MNHPLNQQLALAPTTNQLFPDNVLRLIFDLSIEGPVTVPPPRDDERWNLTRVCQQWRNIITSTPTYWTSFTFRHSLQTEVGRDIFDSLVRPRPGRVRFLSASVTKDTLKFMFGRDPVHFSGLEAMDVAVVLEGNGFLSSRMPLSGSIDLSGFLHAPRLQNVRLHIRDGVHPKDSKLPWGQLTRLDLGGTCVLVHTFVDIIEQCVRLQDGAFCISFATRYYDRQPMRFRRITVPLLRFLRLRFVEPSRDGRVFGSLHTPLLEELTVERDEPVEGGIRDMGVYETLLVGMEANLRHITIAEYHIPMTSRWFVPRLTLSPRLAYQRLEGVLRACQQLTSLNLCPGIFIDPLVLEKLATGELLPFLEQLGVSSVSGWDVIGMVEKRNFVPRLPESGPSSRVLAARLTRPVALQYLRLSLMGCGLPRGDIQKLNDAVMALDLARGYVIRSLDIAEAIDSRD